MIQMHKFELRVSLNDFLQPISAKEEQKARGVWKEAILDKVHRNFSFGGMETFQWPSPRNSTVHFRRYDVAVYACTDRAGERWSATGL